MGRSELNAMVFVAARLAAGWTATPELCAKVRAQVGREPTTRFLVAVTLFHVWLLLGKPDQRAWGYRERVKYGVSALDSYKALETAETTRPAAARWLN